MFSLHNASLKTPHGRVIFHQTQMDFSDSTIHWIVGQSASGKTSLLKGLAGDLTLSAGRITVDYDALGIPKSHSRSAWLKRVGWISPSFPLIAHDSLLDNICLPLTKSQGIAKHEAVKSAKKLMQKLHISAFSDNKPTVCPDGVCLLAKVARSLIHSPKILFCDAIFDYLDGKQQQHLYDCLENFAQSGLSIFLTSYAGPPVDSPSVQTYVLDDGQCQRI